VAGLDWERAEYLLGWREGSAVARWLEEGQRSKRQYAVRPEAPDGKRTSYPKREGPARRRARRKPEE